MRRVRERGCMKRECMRERVHYGSVGNDNKDIGDVRICNGWRGCIRVVGIYKSCGDI